MALQFPNNQVLITGASGWLGHALLSTLTRGQPEVPLLREPPVDLSIRALIEPGQDAQALQASFPGVEFVTGDLRRPEDCERFCKDATGATVFHLVGLIHPRRIHELYDINVGCTRNLHEAAIKAGIKRIVSMSSNSPAGCNPHREHRFTEASPYNPYMHYGRAKMQMEQLVRDIHATGQIETVIIRATWFYGPFHPPRQSLFFQMVRDGKAPIIGDGENLRSMSCVDNVAQALVLAAITGHADGELYWIADEHPYSMNEIVDTVERLLETEFRQHCRHKRLRLPHIACDVARLIDGALQSVGLYHQKIHVLSEMDKHITCSIDKAKKELHYQPAIALEEGLRRSLQQMQERGEFDKPIHL